MPGALRNIGHRLYTGEVSAEFVGRKRIWYIISGTLLVIGIAALLLRGLDLGIEFVGGADFQVKVTQVTSSTVDDFKGVLKTSGVPNLDESTVTTIGSSTVRIQTRTLDVDEVATLRTDFAKEAGVSSNEVAYSLIGASWGTQITQRALIALIVFLVLVMIVIWATFRDWKMSVAAIVALLHDLVLTVGVYALVGFTVTPATLIGVLTILGYSLYDTVVVFDKVRENVRGLASSTTRTYSEAANLAVNQVLVRSINTTVIGILPVSALLFAGTVILGEGPLEDLALALFVGMIAGAYSSIFIATPLLTQMREREPQMVKLRRRVENRRAKLAGRALPFAEAQLADEPAPERKRARGRFDNDSLSAAEAEVAALPDLDGIDRMGRPHGRDRGHDDEGGAAGKERTGGVAVEVVSGDSPVATLGLTKDPTVRGARPVPKRRPAEPVDDDEDDEPEADEVGESDELEDDIVEDADGEDGDSTADEDDGTGHSGTRGRRQTSHASRADRGRSSRGRRRR